MSVVFAPIRAMTRDSPVLKTDWSSSAGIISSQCHVSGTPQISTMAASTPMENRSCWSWTRVYAIGSAARGKCRARTRPRLPDTARVPARTVDWVNVKTKMPVHRNGMKFGMPRLVCSSTPKIK